MLHWKMDCDADGYVWLTIDVAEKSVNVLTHAVLEELDQIVSDLTKQDNIKGLALLSGKPGGFVYGADVRQFELFKDAEAVSDHIQTVHHMMNKLAAAPFPTVVGIEGVAVGGGLELSLAFDWMIATASPKTQLGFPEVGLGILPGYGGSGRSYRRVGLEKALELMMTGKSVNADKALAMGLVDELVASESELAAAARSWLDAQNGVKPVRDMQPLAADTDAIFKAASDAYLSRTRPDHTPAPFAILDHVRDNMADPQAMTDAELTIFPALMTSPASKGLRRLFDYQDRVRKSGRGDSGISHVHVIGAGVMGGDIAAYTAMMGFQVTLSDQNEDAINKAIDRARILYERRLKTEDRIADALSRLVADPAGDGMAKADLMIEAVAERLDIKKIVFRDMEQKAKPDAILATNTSSIPLASIAEELDHPERLVGIHFFNPMPVLPLVEIIWADTTADEVTARAMKFAGQLKKMPIRCKSAPGFLVNRALLPYIYGGISKMLAGTDPDQIDEAMVDYGMPMGPIELADQVGLDVTHDAGLPLGIADDVAAALQEHISKGNLGRKSGSGFYEWDGKKAIRPRRQYPTSESAMLARELLQPMIRECQSAVDEGIVENADMADAGMIFGTGFPGFRGGPLFWASQQK
ncbi:MAG: 3-hydroxyacyl-CoA dehydrogenase NAD-binding domain-containing protein [Candidatus Puniceispirillales bacterium]